MTQRDALSVSLALSLLTQRERQHSVSLIVCVSRFVWVCVCVSRDTDRRCSVCLSRALRLYAREKDRQNLRERQPALSVTPAMRQGCGRRESTTALSALV